MKPLKNTFTLLLLTIFMFANAQDKIILNNKKVIDGKILEVGLNEIKYKPTDNLEGPDYSVSKKEVQLILFANGKQEIIKNTNTKSRKKYLDSTFLKYRNSITTDLFSPIYNDFSIAYERKLKNKNIGLKVPFFVSINKNERNFRYRYYDNYPYNNYIQPEINYTDSTLINTNTNSNRDKNIGFRTGLQTKFYLSQPKKVNWFLSPELVIGYNTFGYTNTTTATKYKILTFDTATYNGYFYQSPKLIDYNNPLSNTAVNNNTKVNQFNIGVLLSTGFEYRPLPHLSLGTEFGMGYSTIFEKQKYTNDLNTNSSSNKNVYKNFIFRTAFNIGIHF